MGAIGGLGGFVSVSLAVNPGQQFVITIGQMGAVNGQGTIGGGGASTGGGSGSGGGSTSVTSGSDIQIIAGGGGGGGSWTNCASGAGGGGLIAATNVCGAGGGTQQSGGISTVRPCIGDACGHPGALSVGGQGNVWFNPAAFGGGGGGGKRVRVCEIMMLLLFL